jgi:uncharacterized protein YacL
MLLNITRALFVLIVAGLGAQLARVAGNADNWALLLGGALVVAVLVLLVDILTPRKRIQTISAVYFGLIVGLVLSYCLQIAIEPTLSMIYTQAKLKALSDLPPVVEALLRVIVCYICVSTLLQTKDDFRFIIPYMEFSREVKGTRPLVLDTSVVIDGRIADVAEARVLDQPLVVPRFVLQELQAIADCRSRPASRSRSTTPSSPSWPASARSTRSWSSWPSTSAARSSPTTTTSTRSPASRASKSSTSTTWPTP